jgi:hypothetical protein
MTSWLPTFCLLLATPAVAVDTHFVQVAPIASPLQGPVIVRSAGQNRAVVLLEGLHLFLFKHKLATRADDLRVWQQPKSVLVHTLVKESDVFAFTYAQNAPVTDVANQPALEESVRRLRQAGYTEVVLVGFSAGGVVAREFVEDHPAAGVTRVIQVCAPNVGSPLARVKVGVGAAQEPFVQSLSKQARAHELEGRRDKRIPDDIEFVCVVGNGLVYSDGVVSTRSQWPEDLQIQGVPAVPLGTEHWEALHGQRAAQVIARLVRDPQPRWDPAMVSSMRHWLWREKSATR